ncbi:MAG: hypothetical protein AAB619_00655 [Patescibacteria group bacterium]|mgnify:FL=1
MKNRYGRPMRIGMELRGLGLALLINASLWCAQPYPLAALVLGCLTLVLLVKYLR